MKKIFILVALTATIVTNRSFAQESQQQNQLSQLLSHYYGIKDALVAGNSSNAAASAEQFIKTLNAVDYKVISEGNIIALLKDATPISVSKDIKKQRDQFDNLSSNMAVLAKAVKLSEKPIFQAYCPMKKAGWLSPEQEIKNPYYGSAMLTCGKFVETIQ
jgi:hypothetical protein